MKDKEFEIQGVSYFIDDIGIIHQRDPQPIDYNEEYIDTYRTPEYEENSRLLSAIRLAFVTGAIGKNPVSIMDVGYGVGDFLKMCKNVVMERKGFDVTGVPVPEGCRQSEIISDYAEVVTMWDVLEHFPSLNEVESLKCKYIAISLPWCHKDKGLEWFESWKHRKPNEHLHHFNASSLITFMNGKGYKLLSVSNLEDKIRRPTTGEPNILSTVFEKI